MVATNVPDLADETKRQLEEFLQRKRDELNLVRAGLIGTHGDERDKVADLLDEISKGKRLVKTLANKYGINVEDREYFEVDPDISKIGDYQEFKTELENELDSLLGAGDQGQEPRQEPVQPTQTVEPNVEPVQGQEQAVQQITQSTQQAQTQAAQAPQTVDQVADKEVGQEEDTVDDIANKNVVGSKVRGESDILIDGLNKLLQEYSKLRGKETLDKEGVEYIISRLFTPVKLAVGRAALVSYLYSGSHLIPSEYDILATVDALVKLGDTRALDYVRETLNKREAVEILRKSPGKKLEELLKKEREGIAEDLLDLTLKSEEVLEFYKTLASVDIGDGYKLGKDLDVENIGKDEVKAIIGRLALINLGLIMSGESPIVLDDYIKKVEVQGSAGEQSTNEAYATA